VSNKQPRRLQKMVKQNRKDDDVTSEESDAELLVYIAVM